MEHRQLGTTGMNISILSFGSSSLGGVFHELEEREGIGAVHTAIDHGINFIDVAPYYGFTRAETLLGKALKNVQRSKYFISTKVGRYGINGLKSWDYSSARTIQSVDESMKRLNLDFIDLINIHDIEFSDLNQVIHETLPTLLRLKKIGKVGHIGITGLPLEKLKYLIEQVPDGTIETVLSFCHYCLNDDSLLDFVPFFQDHHIGIINASPLAMGLLTSRGAPDWHPASNKLKSISAEAAEYCKVNNFPIEKIAIGFSVSNPAISTTLVSTTSASNIKQNIKWIEEIQDKEYLQKVREILKPVYRETWENS